MLPPLVEGDSTKPPAVVGARTLDAHVRCVARGGAAHLLGRVRREGAAAPTAAAADARTLAATLLCAARLAATLPILAATNSGSLPLCTNSGSLPLCKAARARAAAAAAEHLSRRHVDQSLLLQLSSLLEPAALSRGAKRRAPPPAFEQGRTPARLGGALKEEEARQCTPPASDAPPPPAEQLARATERARIARALGAPRERIARAALARVLEERRERPAGAHGVLDARGGGHLRTRAMLPTAEQRAQPPRAASPCERLGTRSARTRELAFSRAHDPRVVRGPRSTRAPRESRRALPPRAARVCRERVKGVQTRQARAASAHSLGRVGGRHSPPAVPRLDERALAVRIGGERCDRRSARHREHMPPLRERACAGTSVRVVSGEREVTPRRLQSPRRLR